MSDVFDCRTPDGLAAGVAAAVEAVRAGRIVVLPTDTVYGVGCDAFDAAAVTAVLAAKGRGREMPPPVLVPGERTVDGLAREVPDYARALIGRFWPGALTLVLRAQSSLQWDLGETNGTVAVRMPDDEVALAVLREVGPMAVTSANRTGMPPASSVQQATEQLGDEGGIPDGSGHAPEDEQPTRFAHVHAEGVRGEDKRVDRCRGDSGLGKHEGRRTNRLTQRGHRPITRRGRQRHRRCRPSARPRRHRCRTGRPGRARPPGRCRGCRP